jgi:hypothetical protein
MTILKTTIAILCLALAGCSAETTDPTSPIVRVPNAPEPAVESNSWRMRRDMPLDMISQADAVVPNAAGHQFSTRSRDRRQECSRPCRWARCGRTTFRPTLGITH